MKIIPVINWVCACFKTSVEDDNFLTEGWECVNLMSLLFFIFLVWEFLRLFWHIEGIIPGNLRFAITKY